MYWVTFRIGRTQMVIAEDVLVSWPSCFESPSWCEAVLREWACDRRSWVPSADSGLFAACWLLPSPCCNLRSQSTCSLLLQVSSWVMQILLLVSDCRILISTLLLAAFRRWWEVQELWNRRLRLLYPWQPLVMTCLICTIEEWNLNIKNMEQKETDLL